MGILIGGGPITWATASIFSGAAMDVITTFADWLVHHSYKPAGLIALITAVVERRARAGAVFDLGATLFLDGMYGYRNCKVSKTSKTLKSLQEQHSEESINGVIEESLIEESLPSTDGVIEDLRRFFKTNLSEFTCLPILISKVLMMGPGFLDYI